LRYKYNNSMPNCNEAAAYNPFLGIDGCGNSIPITYYYSGQPSTEGTDIIFIITIIYDLH